MNSMLNRGAKAAVLAIAVLALGCESSTEPGPQASALGVEAPDQLLGGLIGAVGEVLESGVELVGTVVTVVGDLGSAIIGSGGGVLEVQDHDLIVPAGAVALPTEFSMAVLAGNNIEVDLQALDAETGENVGAKGFAVPVQLALSYKDADIKRRDAKNLVIVQVLDDGTLVPVPSTVNTKTKQVTAELEHFSRYRLCSN